MVLQPRVRGKQPGGRTRNIPTGTVVTSGMAERTYWERIEVKGGELLDKVAAIIREGNARHVRIRQKDHVVAEFPLTIGVVGLLAAPILAAVGALAALLTECTIEVERVVPAKPVEPPAPAATQTSQPS